MHTQAEITKLWCPMARIARRETIAVHAPDTADNATVIGGVNRDALGSMSQSVLHSCRCIGKSCAMFRQEVKPHAKTRLCKNQTATTEAEAGPTPEGFEFVAYDAEQGDEAFWLETEASIEARRLGYCGLASR